MLFIVPIIFLYLSIGPFVDSCIGKEELNEVHNHVMHVVYSESISRGSSHTNMELYLRDGTKYEVTYEWEDKFHEIESELQKRKEVKLFHRYPYQTWWRLGTSDLVYHLEIGGRVIIDIDERHAKSRKVGFFLGVVVVAMFIFLVLRRRWIGDQTR